MLLPKEGGLIPRGGGGEPQICSQWASPLRFLILGRAQKTSWMVQRKVMGTQIEFEIMMVMVSSPIKTRLLLSDDCAETKDRAIMWFYSLESSATRQTGRRKGMYQISPCEVSEVIVWKLRFRAKWNEYARWFRKHTTSQWPCHLIL